MFEGLQYTDADIADFETRLGKIYMREDADGAQGCSGIEFGEVVVNLDMAKALQFQLGWVRHRMSWRQFILALGLHTVEEMETAGIISFSNTGRSQAPEKVSVTNLYYPRGMDVSPINIPYLLAKYLRLFASGRKHEAMISGGQFVARLAKNFGTLTKERLKGQTPDDVVSAPKAAKDAPVVDEGASADPAPIQSPQPSHAAHRTMPHMIARLEEESRFATWMVSCMPRLIDAYGRIYQAFNSTLVDIATCLVKVCKVWGDWEVDRYGNANLELVWQDKMIRDVITVGSTMRISLLYRGEYSQWRERFMNYLEEQTDGEAIINSIQNGDQPLPVIAPVSLAETTQNASPTLKDLKFWTAEEKKTRKIDRLARSLLIQGLMNDIYSLIDSNETTKDYGMLLKGRCVVLKWKQYGTLMRQTKNLMDINIDALYNILKQNQGDVNDALGYKKKAVVFTLDPLALVAEKTKITALLAKAFNRKKYYAKPTNNNLRTSSASSSVNKKPEYVKSVEKKEDKKADEKKRDMSKVKCYNCKKKGHFAKDCKKAKVKDHNYYKTKMFLAKKDSDEQVLLVENQAWMESSSDSDQEINANMVLSNSDESSSSVKETIAKEERYEYMIRYSALCDNDKQHRKKIDEQGILVVKMSHQLVEMNNVLRLQEKILEKETKILELEGCVSNKDVEIEKCLERLNECENKLHTIVQTNQTIHMIMPSKDTLYNGRKGIGFENPSYFEKANDLRPSHYDQKVFGLGYTQMVLTHSDEALEIAKFTRARENKIEFAYDYGNLNANLDTFISVRRPKQSSVIWKKKGSSNTSNVELSSVSHSKLNKDVKRYSRKDLLSCNNSHVGETRCAFVCNDAMNVSCNSRLCDSFDENNLFIFDDESVRISPVSKMPFKKKPHDSLNVRYKRNSNRSLPRTVHIWLLKMQPLAEPLAKQILRVECQIDFVLK
uniref:CCHC-type domain-containing protein n=1 Tax=Tanacetum cinerariifolium TaxID=118510 RepID=A0A6L2J213_TANCI|nr:hypothetical protein [Tanacetum cinerariifolium]